MQFGGVYLPLVLVVAAGADSPVAYSVQQSCLAATRGLGGLPQGVKWHVQPVVALVRLGV